MKELYWHRFLLMKINWNRVFTFYLKRWKGKVAFNVYSALSCCRVWAPPSSQNSITKLPPWELHLASSLHSVELCLWVSMLYLDFFCATISKMVVMVIASSCYAFSAYKRLYRNALLSDSAKNLYIFFGLPSKNSKLRLMNKDVQKILAFHIFSSYFTK